MDEEGVSTYLNILNRQMRRSMQAERTPWLWWTKSLKFSTCSTTRTNSANKS